MRFCEFPLTDGCSRYLFNELILARYVRIIVTQTAIVPNVPRQTSYV